MVDSHGSHFGNPECFFSSGDYRSSTVYIYTFLIAEKMTVAHKKDSYDYKTGYPKSLRRQSSEAREFSAQSWGILVLDNPGRTWP